MIWNVGTKTTLWDRSRVLRVVAAAVMTAAGFSGCGDPNAAKAHQVYPVKGKVVLADGSPLKSGLVVLVSTTAAAEYSGTIGPDGSFEVKTAYGEGAPEGTYKVRIEPDDTTLPQAKGRPGARKAASLPFPAMYNDEATSGLTVTVKSGDNTLEPFKLVPGKPESTPKGGRSLDQRD
jgi:hypothetical protein